MGQTTDQIETHIENKREDLKSNLQELEGRVKSATDWRHYFHESPGMMIAAAFGGGILLSALLGKRRAGERPISSTLDSDRVSPTRTKHEVLEKVDTIKSALVGAAATKLQGILSGVVPGFSEHLAHAERQQRAQADQRERDSTH